MQTCADIACTELVLVHTFEVTCLGTALGAGLAEGIWRDLNAIKALPFEETLIRPASTTKSANGHYAGWLDAVARSKGWVKEQ
jgi:glycerol kinase